MPPHTLAHIRISRLWPLVLGLASLAVPTARANWTSDPTIGLPVCTATGDQIQSDMLPDGNGGAWIVWSDLRIGSPEADIYLHHVLAPGVVDPSLPVDGLVVCDAFSVQQQPFLAPDGAGGVFVGWTDFRLSGGNPDIYIHHVLSNGALDLAWPSNGAGVSLDLVYQTLGRILADEHGGAFLLYASNVTEHSLYLNHILASGARDPVWSVNGIRVSNAPGDRLGADMIADDSGGVLIAWQDRRSTSDDVYAAHVFENGVLDPGWPVNGAALCTDTGAQDNIKLVGDGGGGALVAWRDRRGVSGFGDIYSTHVFAGGVVDSSWPVNGLAVCTAANEQQDVRIVGDGAGGCLITWSDKRGADFDLYAQHVHGNGTFDPGATPNGVPVCTAPGDQATRGAHPILQDGQGGALIAWQDARSGSTTKDIYATHLLPSGAPDPAWAANGTAVSTAAGDQTGAVIAPDGSGGMIVAWHDKRSGTDYDVYAQRVAQNGTLPNVGVGGSAPTLGVRLDLPWPDPARDRARFRFSLARAARAHLRIWSLAGSIVRDLEDGELAAGAHERTWDLLDSHGSPVSNGVYFARLEVAGGVSCRKIVVVR